MRLPARRARRAGAAGGTEAKVSCRGPYLYRARAAALRF